MGTIFSIFISVGCERLSASTAGEGINRFAVNLVCVFRPPLLSTGLATEDSPFLFLLLNDRFATLAASVFIINSLAARNHHAVPATEALNRVFGNSKFPTYVGIPEALSAETYDFLFLFTVHENHLLQVTHGILKNEPPKIKNCPQNKLYSVGIPK